MKMLKLTVPDLFSEMGETREVTAYFHLSTEDLLDLRAEWGGNNAEFELHVITQTEDASAMLQRIYSIVRAAFGVREGNAFLKRGDRYESELNSGIIDAAVDSLIDASEGNPDVFSEFIVAVMPHSIRGEVASTIAQEDNNG